MLYVDGPNRYGLGPFYELHVWVGATIPKGPSWTGTTTYPAQPNKLPGDACLAVLFPVSDAEQFITDASWARRTSNWKQDREGFPANKVRQASPHLCLGSQAYDRSRLI